MKPDNSIIRVLHKIVSLSKTSPYIYTTVQDLLYQAFTAPKPLFKSEEERKEAGDLLKTSLPRLESSLTDFHGSLSVDLRQTAQCVRSGLQFLVDELDGVSSHCDIESILASSATKCIEEYIEGSKGIPSEIFEAEPQDLQGIPSSHFWWKDNDSDDDN